MWSIFIQQFSIKVEPSKVNAKDIWDIRTWKKKLGKAIFLTGARIFMLPVQDPQHSWAWVHAYIYQSQRNPMCQQPVPESHKVVIHLLVLEITSSVLPSQHLVSSPCFQYVFLHIWRSEKLTEVEEINVCNILCLKGQVVCEKLAIISYTVLLNT